MASFAEAFPVTRLAALPAALLLAAALFAVGTTSALAEPYMTVRDVYKCSQCHLNKTGGGPRTDYGGVYMQTRLAAGLGPALPGRQGTTVEVDSGYGRINPAIAVGADIRTSVSYTDFNHAAPTSQFDRPTSCESCHASTSGGGKRAEINFRLQAVPEIASLVYSASVIPTSTTREVYGLIEKLPYEGYVKVGTFRLPSGFQNTFDNPFQHGSQGGYEGLPGFETVRAKGGIELGIEPGPFSASISFSNPDDLETAPRDKRVVLSAYAVTRQGTAGLIYAIDPVSVDEKRTLNTVYLGTSLGRLTGLLQIDQITAKNDDTGTELGQQAWLAELDVLVTKGHNVRFLYEARDPDLDVSNDIRDRTSIVYEPFLTPYLQGRVGYRIYAGPEQTSSTPERNGIELFGELHFMF